MKTIGIVISAVLLLITVPILFTQVAAEGEREFQGVRLAETRYEEISFSNEAQDIKLGGMLFVPDGHAPFPAVVIIHGNGTSKRDNRWYLTMTQYLQENGIAVLLPDKRGSEKSEGDWRSAGFEDLATDTIAAIAYLKGRDDLPVTQIGIVGMSQGGQIAPLVANHSPDVSFVVNVVGAGIPIREQLRYEENHNLREMGLLPGISNLVAYPAAWSITEIRQKEFWNAVDQYDPLPYWQELSVEALALYGEIDPNVPAARSAARLHSLGKDNISVKVYEGSGHALEDPEGQGNRLFREEALRDIKDFILSATATL